MQAYRIETTLNQEKTLILEDLPFQPGELVEVIVLPYRAASTHQNGYPLRGTFLSYINPTEPVASEEWEAVP